MPNSKTAAGRSRPSLRTWSRSWNGSSADLAAKYDMLEKALAAAEAHKTGLLEKHRLERTNWERLREELEHQRAARIALEETLHASEARQMEILEGQRTERVEFQAMREELEKQRTVRLNMEEELRSSEARLTQLAEEQQRERTESAALAPGASASACRPACSRGRPAGCGVQAADGALHGNRIHRHAGPVGTGHPHERLRRTAHSGSGCR